jgi:hypothetical protein
MKNKLQNKAKFNVYITDKALITLENGPKLYVTLSNMVYHDGENWGFENDIVDVDKIEFMGATVEGYKEINKFMEYFASMGINLYREIERQVAEIMDCYGSIEQYVKERIGLDLPSKLD